MRTFHVTILSSFDFRFRRTLSGGSRLLKLSDASHFNRMLTLRADSNDEIDLNEEI